MEDLIIRAIIAENPVPTAIEGRIKWLNQGQSPSDIGEYPIAGNHWRLAAKTIINKIANQKSGIDRPRKAKNEKALSVAVFFFAAEMIPAGTAIRRAIIKDRENKRDLDRLKKSFKKKN